MGRRPTRVELLRAKRQLTQSQLAESAGVSRDVITAIETRRADRQVRAATLQRLAEFFGVDIEELLEEAVA